ncbi:hypothetical protein Sste5346_003100 [Sporothrix stenoceras]|uniref:ABC transporter n=1 Tax=Sporothrix stenoceras TaxID=5173 RepID=A0ABR3ZER8_9PEZI
MAVTKAIYSRLYIRLRVTVRMALAGIIHNRSLTIKDGIFEDSAAMTIVGSDTESAETVGEVIHDLWADLAEFCVGMYLLSRELGWVCICPLLVILYYHKSFVMATQMRVQATKDKLDAIKNIKMMGLVDVMEAKILEARKEEMKRYVTLSKLQIVFIVSAVALNMLSPAITLIAYVIQAEIRGTKAIDVNMVFTSIAIINIVTSPMVSLLSTVAEIAAMVADFDRMQTYLVSPDREDKREIINNRYTDADGDSTHTADRVAANIDNVTIRPASTADPVLKNINAVLKDGNLVVVSGAVGTGKTTLAKALLGDLPPDSGVIQTAYGSIAYCSQTAWLINGTVKDIICGPPNDDRTADEDWYRRVVHACNLEEDFDQMPNWDQTVIGSRGITLSGGQKQRVALARAVYARKSLIILDDVLSALDATTERHIVDNLIGPKGLFKEFGTTVLLITHAVYYFGTIGTARLILLLACLTMYASLVGFNPYWLRWLAEDDGQHAWFYTGIYLMIALGSFVFLSGAFMTIFLLIAPHSGYELHARLLRTVIHAPQSFFDTTDTGTTLNRFSSDMMMIDMQLPFSFFSIFQAVFRLLSQYILLSIVQPFIVAVLPFTFVVLYLVQKIYLPTSRQLRFLDLETRARVNSSFLETLEGVATIRAFGWQQPFIRDNAAKFAQSLQPEYLLSCIQRWLTLVLDLIVPVLAVGIIGLAIAFKGTTTGGQLGIALNVVLEANRYLFNLVEAWTRMETSLGAISRLRTFEKDVLPEDKHVESFQGTPTPAWPDRGAVSLSNLSASYKMPTLALNNVSVDIAPGTKVGVVGRTGSGKSSLLLSFLRIIELEGEGTVRIDGVDVRALPRNTVRGRIITVPQDSMLIMTDSVRQNLDIAGTQVTDEDMIRVLQRVHLWDVLQSRGASAEAAGREARVVDAAMGLASAGSTSGNGEGSSNGGSGSTTNKNSGDTTPTVSKASPTATLDTQMKLLPLSQGQKQLFSLARALLMRPSRGHVVLLDEATSNVDGETDKLMQTLVREEFSEHTVITVAHRLDTIMDSDVVLVLEAGKLVEAGPPSELEAKENGAFRTLIHGKRK